MFRKIRKEALKNDKRIKTLQSCHTIVILRVCMSIFSNFWFIVFQHNHDNVVQVDDIYSLLYFIEKSKLVSILIQSEILKINWDWFIINHHIAFHTITSNKCSFLIDSSIRLILAFKIFITNTLILKFETFQYGKKVF